jgi:hypothetical protein
MNISLTLTNQEITMKDMAQFFIEYKKAIGELVKSEKDVHPHLLQKAKMVKHLPTFAAWFFEQYGDK